MENLNENCKKKKILIVEDDFDMGELIRTTLEKEGYETKIAQTAYEGIDEMRAWTPDLVLLDVMMPGMDGLEALQKIKMDEKLKKTPVLMVSVASDMRTKMSSFLSGARRFITKPFVPEELVVEVRNTFKQMANTRLAVERNECVENDSVAEIFQAESARIFD